MRFRTVLFDLDGTLIDHLSAIHRSYSHTLPQLGYPAPTREQVRRVIGGGLTHAMRQLVPPEKLEAALAIYRPYWDRTMLDDVVLLDGARELIGELAARGVACAVFTNKHASSARRLCEHLGLAPHLRGVFGATDTPWIKPQPEFTAHVLHALHAEAATTLLVGDSPFDIATAREGQLAACWAVTTGTHTRDELQRNGADRVFADLDAIRRELTE